MGEKSTVCSRSPLHSLSFVVEAHIQSGLTGEICVSSHPSHSAIAFLLHNYYKEPSRPLTLSTIHSHCIQHCALDSTAYALSSVQQVQKKERMETIVCLMIALEAATSTDEVAAYEKRENEAEGKKTPLKEDLVHLKIGIDVSTLLHGNKMPASRLGRGRAGGSARFHFSLATDPLGQRMAAPRSCRLAAFLDILCVQMLKVTGQEPTAGKAECGH
ncbi:unnamed protein product [Taenia asiatica]|uniref:Uncharacterized protein n=1 Tax=Taenia asiatica TaxID=60517 RepID=A0A0R3WHB5_TAEAS|nr:unnamed protein product [Taenia asiatica]